MSKRKYTKIKDIEPEVIAMRKAGKTRREIAEHFGLEEKQIKNLVARYNLRQKRIAAGVLPKLKGRPRKEPNELEQLRMENKLLRDFLQFTERM